MDPTWLGHRERQGKLGGPDLFVDSLGHLLFLGELLFIVLLVLILLCFLLLLLGGGVDQLAPEGRAGPDGLAG